MSCEMREDQESAGQGQVEAVKMMRDWSISGVRRG